MSKSILMLLLAVLLTACVAEDPTFGLPLVSPLIPNPVPVLLENQWRLTEIIDNGTRHDFDAIDPVLATFSPGSLTFRACNSGRTCFDTTGTEAPNEYRLRHGDGTARDCPGGGTEQQSNFLRPLHDTSRYEIEGDRLILSGENAQLTFVIDNEATKPPDWP